MPKHQAESGLLLDVEVSNGLHKDLHTTTEQGGSLVTGVLLKLPAPTRRLLWPAQSWVREPRGHGTHILIL